MAPNFGKDRLSARSHSMEHLTRVMILVLLGGLMVKNMVVGLVPLAISLIALLLVLLVNLISDARGQARVFPSSLVLAALSMVLLISAHSLGIGGALWAFPALVSARVMGSRTLSVPFALFLSTAMPVILAIDGDPANAVRLFGAMMLTSFYVAFAQGSIPTLREASESISARDPLTNAFDRSRLDRVLANLDPSEKAGCLLIEIDGFDQVNNDLGWAAGDMLLRNVAATVQDFLGEREKVYRVGAAEFFVLLKGWNDYECRALADRIKARVADNVVLSDRSSTVSIGCSVLQEGGAFDEAFQDALRDLRLV